MAEPPAFLPPPAALINIFIEVTSKPIFGVILHQPRDLK
jgi:hypothetical protein